MKKLHLAVVYLGVALLATGCGGGGSSGTTTSGTSVSGKVTITNVNAPDVAKGAATPSQGMAKAGSNGASAVGVVVQPGVPKKSVMDIALAELKRVKDMKMPAAPAGAVGVITGLPLSFNCTTSGTLSLDATDTNSNGQFDVGDVFVISFSNCVEPDPSVVSATTTTNGSMSLTINTSNYVLSPSAGTPLVETVSMSFTGFSVVDTAPNPDETITMSGGMTLAISNNGTALTATMSGTTFSMTSTTDGAFTMKDFTIGYTETIATGAYSFTVSMTTSIAALSGDIVITTPTPFTGTGDNNPTAGVMVITGANGGTLTLTAQSDGTTVAMELDTDGASGSTAPQALASTTWDAI